MNITDKYQLTLRFNFECIDDVQAKESAEKLITGLGIGPALLAAVDVVKLQKVHTGRTPEGIKFKFTKMSRKAHGL